MKRIISLFLAVIILIGLLPTQALAAQIITETPLPEIETKETAAAWDGTVATEFARGNGTSSQPYIIETPQQLAYFAQLVNSGYTDFHVHLAADINLGNVNWTPIGNNDYYFDGIFRGNGYTISGLLVNRSDLAYQGLFGKFQGVVSDLTLSGSISTGSLNSSENFIGLFAGENTLGTITNVHVSGTVGISSAASRNNVGGFCGKNMGIIENCSANATVNVSASATGNWTYVGGMAGENSADITACFSSGSVSFNSSGSGSAGGFCGIMSYGGNDVTFSDRIYNCYSTSSVTTSGNNILYAGGLVGRTGSNIYIQNCYSTGSVSATGSSDACAGGLVGYVGGGSIIKCYAAAASVSSTYSSVIKNGEADAGRLVGNYGDGSASGCIARSDTAIKRTVYFDDGCDTGNTTSTSPSCTAEGTTFAYGSDNPMSLLGWSSPWVSNGNNPILAHQKYLRCTVRYMMDGNVFRLATQYVPTGTAVNITSPAVDFYSPSREVVDDVISGNKIIEVTYSRNTRSVTVTCVDADGNVLDVYAEPIPEGTTKTITAKTLTGYTPRQTSMTVDMGTSDISMEWVYDVNNHPVTIYYKYLANDAMAAETYTTTLNYGEALQVSSPRIVGYQVANAADETVIIESMGDAPYEKTVYYVEQEQLSYTVVAMLGTKPLSGVTVTFNGVEKVTDNHGQAIFLYDQGTETVTLQLHKDGYSSQAYELPVEYRLKTGVGIDYFSMKIDTADNPNYSVQGITCFGNDISTNSGIINVKYDGLIPIVIKASIPAEDKIQKILLVQEVDALSVDSDGNVVDDNADHTVHKILRTVLPGDEALSDDGTCEFTMKGTEFAYTALEKRPIYVYLYTEHATEPVIQRLNINTISLSTEIKFEGLFDKAECSLSGTGLPMLDGTKLSFEMDDKYKVEAPFCVEIINNEIYIGYDVTDAFKDELQNMKDNKLFDKAKNMENRASKFMESMGKAVDNKFADNKWISSDTTTSFKIEAEAAAGMCFTVYEDGKIAAKSYAKVGISMNASWTTDFMVVIIPITVEAKVGLSGEITVTGLGLDFEHQEIIWPTTTVSLAANLRLSAGIGNRFASAGVFGSIKIGTELVLGETTYFDALILNGKGGFYAKLNLGLFSLYGEKSWTFLDKTIHLAPKGQLLAEAADPGGYLGQFDGLPVYDISAYSFDTMSDTGQDQPEIPNWSVSSMTNLADGALDTASPEIVALDGREIVVYFGTASNEDIANAKQLFYQVKNSDGTWSTASAVADDGTGDTDFNMLVYEGKLYLAYAQSKTNFSSADYENTATLLNDMTFAQEITVAVFDPETSSFQTVTQLTNDSYYDTIPTFGIVNDRLYLVWNKNTALDDSATFCMNTKNYIWYTDFDGTDWSQPQCALHGCYPVVDLAVTGLGGQPEIALIVDEDASLYTEDDQNLYLTDLEGNLTLINCYGSAISRLQAVTHNGASLLLWRSNNAIMALSDPGADPFQFSSEEHQIGEDFQYINTADQQAALIWCVKDIAPKDEKDTLTSKISIAILNGQGIWSDPVTVASVPYHIMNAHATLSDGSLRLALVDTYLSSPEETGEETLVTFSKLLYRKYSLPRQIRIDNHKIATNRMQELQVSITVTNTGATAVDELTFILVDEVKEGDWLGVIYEYGAEIPVATKNYTKNYTLGTSAVNLAPGETGTYTFTLSINSTMSMTRTKIVALFPGDSFISGGVVEDVVSGSTIEGVDFGVTGEYIIIDETEFLSVRVDNFGKTTGSGRLEVYRQNEDNTETLVHSEDISSLMSSNIKYYLIKLEKDFFQQTAEDFRCVIISENDENPDNDQVTILARKLEGQSGTERDLLVAAPEMSEYKATLDRYSPSDITLSITMNEDILRYIGCVDMGSHNIDHTLTESEDGKTLHIALNGSAMTQFPLGEHELRFLFLTDLGYIDSIFLVNIIDTTPIPLTGELLVTDGNETVQSAKRGMTLWLDTQYLNTEQVNFHWLLDGVEVGTQRSLVIEESFLGKQLIAEVTGETPYYGTIRAIISVEQIPRMLDSPLIADCTGSQVSITRVFHVGGDTLLYGFSTENDPSTVSQWQTDTTLTLPGFGTYYLFTKAPGTQVYAPVISPAAVYEYACTHEDLTEQSAVSPGCEEPGWNLYYICNSCGQVLTADGKETTQEAQQIPALGHDWSEKTEDADHLKELAADCSTHHTYWYGCSRCGAISTTEFYESSTYGDHQFENGSCSVCGELDPQAAKLMGKYFSLSFEDEILVNFYFTAENIGDAEVGMLVFYTEPGTVDISNADEKYDATLNTTTNLYSSTTDGIAAKQISDIRYYAIYAKRSDGSFVYSPIYQYSPKKYALNMIGRDSTDTDLKALCVAMLNYGAAAQRYFNYRTDDLMNADLTAEQQALVVSYDSGLFAGAIPVDPSKIGSFSKTNLGFSGCSATVSFDGAFAINYYFKPNASIEGDISFYYWNAEDYAAATTLTASNATGMLVMRDNGDGTFYARVTGIAAKQIDDTYYVTAVYNNADGQYCSGIIAYSLSRYCMNNAKDGNPMQDLASSTAVYGYHAKQYFG